MRPRRLVVGALAAGVMVVGGAGSASANIAWCMVDPPVQVQTQSGTNLTVNVAVTVMNNEARNIKYVVTTWVTTPQAGGGTLITLQVNVPASITAAQVTATVKKFKVSTPTVTVAGGSSTTLYLVVPAT